MTTEQRITRLEKAFYELIESSSTIDKIQLSLFPNTNSIWQEIYNELEEYARLKEKHG